MGIKETRQIFSAISKSLTIKILAKKGSVDELKNGKEVDGELPIFDALELLKEYPVLKTSEGFIFRRDQMMKKPVRVLFFTLSAEIEYSLYKIAKQYVRSEQDLKVLHSLFLNDLIRRFLDIPDILSLQNIYPSLREIKNDLKAFSSFRNMIVHSNVKIELEADYLIILDRKKQILNLLNAFEQIRSNLKSQGNYR